MALGRAGGISLIGTTAGGALFVRPRRAGEDILNVH